LADPSPTYAALRGKKPVNAARTTIRGRKAVIVKHLALREKYYIASNRTLDHRLAAGLSVTASNDALMGLAHLPLNPLLTVLS